MERPRCGQMALDGSGIACDRWQHHDGNHRGYREEQDAVVFWRQECGAVHHSTGAVCELPIHHDQNHRGPFAHGISQWPESATPVNAGATPTEVRPEVGAHESSSSTEHNS